MSGLTYNTFLIYFLIAAVQGIILSSLIIFQKPRKASGTYIGVLLFLFAISILHGVLEDSIHAFNAKFLIPLNYGMLYGPFAFFHIKSLLIPGFRFEKKMLLHFVPSFFIDFLFSIVLYSYAGSNMEWAYENIVLIRLAAFSQGTLVFVHIAIYTIAIFKIIGKADLLSDSGLKKLKGWILTFRNLWLAGVLLMLILMPIIYLAMEREDYGYNLFFPMGIFDSLFIYWLGYSYLLKYRPIVFQYLNKAERIRYSKEEIESKKQELIHVFEKDGVYTDQKLSLNKLAEMLEWSPKEVSWMIGEFFEMNFNDFVNQYRVKEFLERVTRPDGKKYSMDGLAKDVGFNSKASFYRSFKKIRGQSPGEFLESISN